MEKRKVIIDCDPGIDDSLAILLALASDELEVLDLQLQVGMYLLYWEQKML